MKNVGNFLKMAREQQGLSLEDVADRTKIHIQKLTAIEEGTKDLLPAKVFCIGLIKSYARELKVDMTKIDQLCLAAFSDEVIPTVESSKTPNDDETPIETQPVGRFQIPKIVGITISLAVSLILIVIISQVIEKMNSYSQEEELPQEVFIQDTKPVDDELAVDALILQEKEKVIAEIADQKPKKENPKALVTPKIETKVIRENNTKALEKISKTSQDSEYNDFSDDNFDSPEPDETREEQVVVISDNKLTLTALEPVRAEIVWSDGFVQVMLLKGQESKTLVFSQPITLRVNNGGAVQVSFNDGEKTVPGTFNQPIEIHYP